MNTNIEDTRAALHQDNHNTKQDFRAHAAQIQHDTEKSKMDPKRFAEEVQQALSNKRPDLAAPRSTPSSTPNLG